MFSAKNFMHPFASFGLETKGKLEERRKEVTCHLRMVRKIKGKEWLEKVQINVTKL